MILSYDNKVQNKKLNSKTIYYGVELEVSVKSFLEKDSRGYNSYRDQIASRANTIFPHFDKHNFIFKWDSSVIHGYEIVTPALTFDKQKEVWVELINILNDKGYCSYEAPCNGMHIHVSKRPLTRLQIAKIIKFVYSRDNRRMIRKIAQRHEKDQASFRGKRSYGHWREGLFDRHTAINITNETLEFRLFKGTLSLEAFYKNLEFCRALIDFCYTSKYSVNECLVWWNFIDYIRQNKKIYSNLWSYCLNKKMTQIEEWNEYLKERELAQKKTEEAAEMV